MENMFWRVIVILILIFGFYFFAVMHTNGYFVSFLYDFDEEEDNSSTNVSDDVFHTQTYNASSHDYKPFLKLLFHKWYETMYKNVKKGKDLCVSAEKKFVDCSLVISTNYACIDEESGAIDICGFSGGRGYLTPLCKDKTSSKIITCGDMAPRSLCLPKIIQTKINLVTGPCSDRERHLCLIEDGSIDMCSSSGDAADNATDANWKVFWIEWQPLKKEAEKEKSGIEAAALCMNSQNKIDLCESRTTKSEICVGVVSGEVGVCKEMNETNHLVHLCLAISTQEIVTCGNSVVANLCLPSSEKVTPLRPCLSKSRRICLLNKGLLGNCSNVTQEHAFLFPTETTVTVKDTAEERIVIENQQKGLIQLCKNDTEDKVYKCNKNSSLFAACLSMNDGNIKTCSEIESKAEVGIPVCIQETTSYLVTCEMFTHSNLCLQHSSSSEKFHLSHCRMHSHFACVTGEGSLKFCSSRKKYTKKGNFTNENLNYTLPMKYNAFELKVRSVTYLCKPNEENELVQCSDDANLQVACLDLEDGKIISSCKSMEYTNLNIPVCIMGSEKYVVTCGKFNLVPVCMSEKNASSKYSACGSTKNAVCLRSRAIQPCNNDLSGSEDIKKHYISRRKVSKPMKLPEGVTNYSNKKRVYDAESNILASIMKDRERLCLKKGQTNRYSLCTEESEINFVCLRTDQGRIKNCDQIEATALGVPLCVKKSNELTTCGKFSRSPLCLYEVLDDILMTGCTSEGIRACLSEKGYIESCRYHIKNDARRNKYSGYNQDENEDKKESPRDKIKTKILKMINDSHVHNMMLCITGDNPISLINCDDDPSINFACLGAVEGNVKKCSSYKEDFPIAVCARVKSNYFVTCDITSKAHLCHSKKATSSYTFPCDDPDLHSCVTEEGALTKCVEQIDSVPLKSGYKEDDTSVNEPSEQDPIVITSGPDDEAVSFIHDKDEEVNPIEKAGMHSAYNELDFTIGTYADDDSMDILPMKMSPTPGDTNEKFYRILCSNCSINHKFVIVGTPDDVLPATQVYTFPKEE